MGFFAISGSDDRGNIRVSSDNIPPLSDGHVPVQPYYQYLTDDGSSSGAFDARAVASPAAPVSFYIQASPDRDTYITSLSFMIADAGATLNQFGSIPALTNGCRLYYEDDLGEAIISTILHSNFDFVRLCGGNPAVGGGANAFRASNVLGTSEAYIPVLDFSKFTPGGGILLRMGTVQRLVLELREDTTGIDGFNAVASGYQRLPHI